MTYVYPTDLDTCLTPNHLLYCRRLEYESCQGTELRNDINIQTYSETVTNVLEHFWLRWRTEYLAVMRERHKSEDREIGDVVIVQEEFLPRKLWKLGLVETLVIGKDGQVRGAEVHIGKTGSLIKRPVNRLYPIEYFRYNKYDEVRQDNYNEVDRSETKDDKGTKLENGNDEEILNQGIGQTNEHDSNGRPLRLLQT